MSTPFTHEASSLILSGKDQVDDAPECEREEAKEQDASHLCTHRRPPECLTIGNKEKASIKNTQAREESNAILPMAYTQAGVRERPLTASGQQHCKGT
mmetsp:Transcript_103140/g.204878  ORF Transcript_103140/g.204878 Transcript_103140/m.204878 type:complete len:98 (-) Transcript_103140:2397-2690(-)